MLNIIKSAIYGIVEGITEWLPISSTGHMILLNEILPMDVSKDFWNLFLVVIQFGAILAVILMYFRTIWPFALTAPDGTRKLTVKHNTLKLWVKTIIACIPAGIVGVLLDDWLDEHLYNWVCVAIMLYVVGIAFLIIEARAQGKEPRVQNLDDLSYRDAFIIGLFQLIAAVFPGTSRSGATILGGIMIGISRTVAAEFTFVLAIPVMAGASLLKILKYNGSFTGEEWAILLTGMGVAFAVSILVIRFLMNYIRNHSFKVFAWYRIVLGIVVILFFGLAR